MSIDHSCVCNAVIIGANIVAYAVCKYVMRFNLSSIHIKRVDLQKFLDYSVDLLFIECILVSVKFRRFYEEAT